MSCGNCTDCSNKCDVCLNCDGPKSPHASLHKCNSQQTYCTGDRMSGQLVSSYMGNAGAPTITKDDIIIKKLPLAEFNRLLKYALNAAQHKTMDGNYWWDNQAPDSIAGGHVPADPETRPHVYADKVETLLKEMIGLTIENWPGDGWPAKNQVIYAQYFNNIMQKLNNLKINSASCHSCVSGCDTVCNTCNTCDTCISCNTCQSVSSYSSHYSSHYSSW